MTHWLVTADGVRLAARHHPPASPSREAVVVVHGFSASQDHPEVVGVAEALVADGFHVVTYDSRGHGASEGVCTLGDLERLDVGAAVALALEHAARVVLLGASMGAIAVLRYAATHGDVDGVVAVSSPAEWKLPRTLRGLLTVPLTRTRIGRWFAHRNIGVRVAEEWTRPEPPTELVKRIEVPVAFVHGLRDRLILPNASVQLHAHGADRWRLELVHDMDHAFDPAGIPAIRAAVAWTLRAPTPTPFLAPL